KPACSLARHRSRGVGTLPGKAAPVCAYGRSRIHLAAQEAIACRRRRTCISDCRPQDRTATRGRQPATDAPCASAHLCSQSFGILSGQSGPYHQAHRGFVYLSWPRPRRSHLLVSGSHPAADAGRLRAVRALHHRRSAMTSIAPHMEAFLRERLPLERGASINTCDSYAYAFRLLLQYASECLKVRPSELQLEQLDAPLILNFLKHLETKRHNGQNSRNTRLAAVKSFMHFMEYRVPSALEQIRRVLAIPAKKTESRLVKHLSVEELQSIIDAPLPSESDGIRDRAMLHLCFAAALRVSELVGLRLTDVTLPPQASVLIHGN